MAGLNAAIQLLITTPALQVDFFNDPEKTLAAIAPNLDLAETAVLFSTDRAEMLAATQLPEIEEFHFHSAWPRDWEDWKFGHPLAAPFSLPPGVLPITVMASAAMSAGGGWTDPSPHGRGIKPAQEAAGTPFTLTILGEGFMDEATVSFFRDSEYRKPNGQPEAFVPAARLVRRSDGSIYGNFRTRYLQLQAPALPAGRYVVGIDNLRRNPVPAPALLSMTAGQVLDIQ